MEGSLKDQPTFFFSRWHFRGERELFIPVGTKNVFVVRFVKKNCNKRFGFVYIRVYLYF